MRTYKQKICAQEKSNQKGALTPYFRDKRSSQKFYRKNVRILCGCIANLELTAVHSEDRRFKGWRT